MNNDLERLAIMQALYKELGKEVGTRNPDGIRAKVDAGLLARYAEDGTDRRRIMVNGVQIGTQSIRFTRERARAIMEDADALAEWLCGEDGRQMLDAYMREKGQSVAEWLIEHMNGELPDGVTAYIEPAHPDGTVLKGCEFDDVVGALGLNLPQAVAYALTDGGE